MAGPGVITKRVLQAGKTYFPSQGKAQTFSADRIAGMAERFAAMKAAGLRIPVPFKHPKADGELFAPVTVERAGQTDFSPADHAGWLDGLRLSKDGWMEWDIAPKAGVDPETFTGFSPAIAEKYRDGAGREWDDVLMHAAVVYHPIATDQPQGDLNRADGVSAMGVVFLAADSGEPKMAKDKEPVGGAAPDVKAAIDTLNSIGLAIPADTSLLGLLTAIEAAIVKLKGAAAGEPDKADDVVPPPSGGMPVVMAAKFGQMEGRLATLEADNNRLREERHAGAQTARKGRIEALRQRQILAPARADKLLADLGVVTMSAAVNNPVLVALDSELDTLERLNPGAVFGAVRMSAVPGYQPGQSAAGAPPKVSASDVMAGKAAYPRN